MALKKIQCCYYIHLRSAIKGALSKHNGKIFYLILRQKILIHRLARILKNKIFSEL